MFLRLTHVHWRKGEDDRSSLINMNRIGEITPNEDGGSLLYLGHDCEEPEYVVEETPEQIMEMMAEPAITLTSGSPYSAS